MLGLKTDADSRNTFQFNFQIEWVKLLRRTRFCPESGRSTVAPYHKRISGEAAVSEETVTYHLYLELPILLVVSKTVSALI
jgi:hypothetical protein